MQHTPRRQAPWRRAIVIALAAAWLVAIVPAWVRLAAEGDADLRRCEAGACEGEPVVLVLARVTAVDGDRWRVIRGALEYPVAGLPPPAAVDEEVSVGGTWRDGVVHADWVEAHPLRPWKRRLGLLSLGFLVVAAPRALRRLPDGWGLGG